MSKPVTSRGWIGAFSIVAALAIVALAIAVFPGKHFGPAAAVKAASTAANAAARSRVAANVAANYAAMPLAFERNQGQTDAQVQYMARGSGYTLFLTPSDAVFSLSSRAAGSDSAMSRVPGLRTRNSAAPRRAEKDSSAVVRMQLVGGNAGAQVSASGEMPGKSNYYIGNEPSKWRTGVEHYARVAYANVYPGVNLAFHGAQRQVEFDFVVARGANPSPIAFQFSGNRGMKTDEAGNLVVASAAGDVLLHKPVAYQEKNGARELVDARFSLKTNNQVGFELGTYDRGRELVIDPSVSYAYSTYLGGTGTDTGFGIGFDSFGNTYVTGQTASANFPGATTTNKLKGAANAFVTKIAADGSSLIYSNYIGGTGAGGDSGNAIAVNQTTGAAYVTGGTESTDFPTTTGAFQTALGSGALGNAFILELNASGGITYSTYLGGSGDDIALGIALDSSGDVYTVGETSSTNFPLSANPLQPNVTGGFVTKLNPAGTGAGDLKFSTYLGGGTGDFVGAVALDSSTNVYVTGRTSSLALHTTPGAFQTTAAAAMSAFVTVVKTDGSAYLYSTYLGGSGDCQGDGIAVDSSGNAYVTGLTALGSGIGFPLTSNAAQLTYGGGGSDAFITQLKPAGTGVSDLVYSTYLGGSLADAGAAIALDSSNDVYVTGQTYSSSGFATTANATQATFGGSSDAFVSEVNSSGQLVFSTYLGGTGDEDTTGNYGGIAVDGRGLFIYVTGDTTSSTGFHTQPPYPYTGGNTYGGNTDAYAVKYAQGPSFSMTATTPAAVAPGASATSTVALTAYNGYSSAVALSCAVTGSGSPLPSCSASSSFSPASPITPAGTPGTTTTLTVTTTAATAENFFPRKMFYALGLPVVAFSFLGVSFSSARSRRKKVLGFLIILMVMAALFLMPACGGSSSSGGGGGGGNPGTPAGTYTVTITGAGSDAATITQMAQFSVVVN